MAWNVTFICKIGTRVRIDCDNGDNMEGKVYHIDVWDFCPPEYWVRFEKNGTVSSFSEKDVGITVFILDDESDEESDD